MSFTKVKVTHILTVFKIFPLVALCGMRELCDIH